MAAKKVKAKNKAEVKESTPEVKESTPGKRVSIFDSPEEIDAVILNRLNSFPAKGAKNTRTPWTEDELELRDAVIWDYLTEQHLSRERTAQQIAARWGVYMSSARRYVADAIKRLTAQFKENEAEELRKKYIEQLETVIQNAYESKSYDAQLRGLDILGKVHGYFNNKTDVTLAGDATIHFDFN